MSENRSCPECGKSESYTVYQEDDRYYYECKNCGCTYGHAQTNVPSSPSKPPSRCPACGKTEVDAAKTAEGKNFFVCKSCGCTFWPTQPETLQSLNIRTSNVKKQNEETLGAEVTPQRLLVEEQPENHYGMGVIFGTIFGAIAWYFSGGSWFWGGLVFLFFFLSITFGEKAGKRSREALSEQAEAMETARHAMTQVEVVQGLGKQIGPLQRERKRLFEEQLRLEEKKEKLEQELASTKGDMRLTIEKEIMRLAKRIEMLKEIISKKDTEINLLLHEMRTESLR